MIAKQVKLIASEYDEDTDPISAAAAISRRLFDYSVSLDEWAATVADTMLKRVASDDYSTWMKTAEKISKSTKQKLKDAVIGPEYARLQREQIDLIKSIPLSATEKVHEWTKTSLSEGERPATLAKRIREELGSVSETKAILIARTEVARARSNFTMARAKAVGSTHYVWHTVGDGAVRPRHAKLDGKVFAWDSPPVCEVGKGGTPVRAAPGCVWNCRCFAEPLFPKTEYDK